MDKRFLILVICLVITVGLMVPLVLAKPTTREIPECKDELDNDGDGYIDWPDDPGCQNKNDKSELNPNIECDDGVDNEDADSLVDYNDPGCSDPSDDDETDGDCDDTSDNDGDTYIDYPSDPGCTGYSDSSELGTVECDDGSDNDGDNEIDYNDDGCSGPTDDDETNCGDDVCEGGEVCDVCIPDCGHCDSCNDTDEGNYPLIFGTASGYLNDIWYSDDDYCVDSGNIMEYYCSGDYEQSQQQSCGTDAYGDAYCSAGDEIYKDFTDYFCSSGACDSNVTPEFQEDCDTSDGYGSNYCFMNLVKRDYYNYFCTGGTCDYNTTPETVEDCDESDGYGSNYCEADIVKRDYYDYYCSGGTCNFTTTPETVEDCDESDWYGPNYCSGGDVYRNFYDYSCVGAECNLTIKGELVEECDYGCTNGECDPIPDSCSDSDYGITRTIVGTVDGYLNEQYYNDTDYCIDTTWLVEYFCNGNYAYNTTIDCTINATTSCSSGKCI